MAALPVFSRSAEILLRFARQDVRFLRTFDIKALLVACGTVSTTALPRLQAENADLPMLGVVEPSCRRAVSVTRNKRVGLIATAASVRSGAYERTIAGLDGDITAAVGDTGRVAEVYNVLRGQSAADLPNGGKAAQAGVKNADGAIVHRDAPLLNTVKRIQYTMEWIKVQVKISPVWVLFSVVIPISACYNR